MFFYNSYSTDLGTGGVTGARAPCLKTGDRASTFVYRFNMYMSDILLKLARNFNIMFGMWATSSSPQVPNYIRVRPEKPELN